MKSIGFWKRQFSGEVTIKQTIFVLLRYAIGVIKRGRTSQHAFIPLVAGVCLLTFVIPAIGQVILTHNINEAIQKIISGNATEAKEATIWLKRISFWVDYETLEREYFRGSSDDRQAKLAEIYDSITGEDIDEVLRD